MVTAPTNGKDPLWTGYEDMSVFQTHLKLFSGDGT